MSILSLFFCCVGGVVQPPTPLPTEVNPAFEEAYQEFWATAWQMEQDGVNDVKGRQYMIESAQELMCSFGRAEFIQQLLLIQYELETGGASEREQMQARSMPVFVREFLDEQDVVRAAIRFWPSPDCEFHSFLFNVLKGIAYSDEAQYFRVGFDAFANVILEDCPVSDVGSLSSHSVCGPIVDFMFERHAFMAWHTMLEIGGADETELTAHYEKIVAIIHPYNDYYRTRPDDLPPGTREGMHELLVEYSQDDSLWARVFVAEILNKVPYMRDPEIETALREDPHWLIQRRMAYLDEEGATEED